MYFLIYSSYATVDFTHEKLKDLLTHAREKNAKIGVSGMLLFLGGQFIQFLEGEEQYVKTLYNEICYDKRHKGVVLLKEGNETDRLFADWLMAFRSVTSEELMSGAGFEKLNSVLAFQIFKELSIHG